MVSRLLCEPNVETELATTAGLSEPRRANLQPLLGAIALVCTIGSLFRSFEARSDRPVTVEALGVDVLGAQPPARPEGAWRVSELQIAPDDYDAYWFAGGAAPWRSPTLIASQHESSRTRRNPPMARGSVAASDGFEGRVLTWVTEYHKGSLPRRCVVALRPLEAMVMASAEFQLQLLGQRPPVPPWAFGDLWKWPVCKAGVGRSSSWGRLSERTGQRTGDADHVSWLSAGQAPVSPHNPVLPPVPASGATGTGHPLSSGQVLHAL